MLQAPILDDLSFAPFPSEQEGLALPDEVVVVVGDEGSGLGFEIARQIVGLRQDPVFQGLVLSPDLALELAR